jgi:hypothetical protein
MTAPGGKVFGGWKLGETVYAPGDSYAVTGDLSFTAQWIDPPVTTYTVTFDKGLGGGIAPASQTVKAGGAVSLPGAEGMTAPGGKVFGGWKLGETVYDIGASSVVTGDVIFTAQWEDPPVVCTVTFDKGAGGGTAPASQTVNFGVGISLPDTVGMTAPAGTVFGGWRAEGTVYAVRTFYTVTGDVSFAAQWNFLPYTVAFDKGAGGGTAPANRIVGGVMTLPNGEGMTAPSGKVFVGWKAGETVYAAGDSYTVTGDVTFIAQWDFITYTVSFDKGSGGGTAPAGRTVNGMMTLPDETGMTAPSGKLFVGWKTGEMVYAAAAFYMVTGDVTFTAQWAIPTPNWTAVADSTFGNTTIFDIAWGNNKFVAVGGSGRMGYSTGGETWTAVSDSAFGTTVIDAIAWGNNRFVAVGLSGKMAYSADGETWTAVSDSTFGGEYIRGIVWGNNRFVAVGTSGKTAYSADGESWTAVSDSALGTAIFNDIAWGNNKFVAAGYSGTIAYSSDGETWTAAGNSTFGTAAIESIAWGNNRFVAVGGGGRMAYSADGETWTAVSDSAFETTAVRSITWGNDKFVAVGDSGRMVCSIDGETWTTVGNTTFGTTAINGIAWGNNRFVAVGYSGKVACSD